MADVRIDVEEDSSRVGYALITFAHSLGYATRPRLYVARKFSDTPYLGKDGWQVTPFPFDAEVVSGSDRATVLRVGPELADRVPFEMHVRLQVEGTDVTGAVFWPEISPKLMPYFETIVAPPTTLVSEPEPEEPPPPPPPPEDLAPEKPPEEEQKAEEKKEETGKAEEPPPVEPWKPHSPKQPRRSWLWIVIAILILVAGAALYEFVLAPKPEPESVPFSTRFEQLRNNDPLGSGLLQLSRDAYAANDKELGLRALLLAIERKNQTAKLEQAKWYDPRTYRSDRVVGPSANVAARAYWELAEENRNSEAASLLSGLCALSREPGSANDRAFQGFEHDFYCQNVGQ